MSRVVKLGQSRSFAPSPGVIALWPCFQSASDASPYLDRVEDRSGRGNHALLGVDAVRATAWGTASRYSSVDAAAGTTDHAAKLAWSAVNWDKDKETLLIAGNWSGAAGTNRWVFGFGGNSSTAVHGFMLRGNVAGTVRLQLSQAGALTSFNDSAATVVDGSIHHFILVVDGTSKRAHVYLDGVYDATLNGSIGTDWAPYAGSMSAYGDLTLGGCPHTSAKNLTYAATMYGFQVAKRTGATPSNMAELARRLYKHPLAPLTAQEWPAA